MRVKPPELDRLMPRMVELPPMTPMPEVIGEAVRNAVEEAVQPFEEALLVQSRWAAVGKTLTVLASLAAIAGFLLALWAFAFPSP